jgi:hypothetical protein
MEFNTNLLICYRVQQLRTVYHKNNRTFYMKALCGAFYLAVNNAENVKI